MVLRFLGFEVSESLGFNVSKIYKIPIPGFLEDICLRCVNGGPRRPCDFCLSKFLRKVHVQDVLFDNLVGYAKTASVGIVLLTGSTVHTELSGRS